MRWAVAVVAIQVFTIFLYPRGSEAAGYLPPFLSPSSSNGSCDDAICGQGTCKALNNSILGLFGSYSCECSPGWTKLFDGENFQFLPCVIPNCTMNYSCVNETLAPTPPPVPHIPSNLSFFDPCSLAMCGDGDCQKTSTVSYHCNCKPGSSNLINNTIFPCSQQCAVGTNCVQLGINVPTSSSPPGQSSNSMPPPSKGKGDGVRQIALTEEHARDNFQNLLFSVCRYRELTEAYPRNITVASYDFKEERFAHLHGTAIGFS